MHDFHRELHHGAAGHGGELGGEEPEPDSSLHLRAADPRTNLRKPEHRFTGVAGRRRGPVTHLGNAPLVVTQGDPAGVGPELTLRAWLERRELDLPPFAIVADPVHLTALA